MATYLVRGFLTYSVAVEVEADSPEEALEKAESDDWDRATEEGSWKTAGGFVSDDSEPERADAEEGDDDD